MVTEIEVKERMKKGKVKVEILTSGNIGEIKSRPDSPTEPSWLSWGSVEILLTPPVVKRKITVCCLLKNVEFVD